MLDKFLNSINNFSTTENSIKKQINNYNKEVLLKKSQEASENNNNKITSEIKDLYQSSLYSNALKTNKYKNNDFKSNDFKSNNKIIPKDSMEDGSVFCSYAIDGNTLICYKDKEKIELVLDKISYLEKNSFLAKKANYFLNDLVKKKKVYIDKKENGKYSVYLDSKKENSINDLLISEGFHNSESSNIGNQKSSSDKQTELDLIKSEFEIKAKEKKSYAYGLFAISHTTFEALFENNKITLTLDNLNLELISKEDQKTCKSMIYDFVSKKSIILKFKKEENGIHFVEVFNKEDKCLNSLIASKNFKILNNSSNEDLNSEDSDLGSDEKDIPEITVLHSMFKKNLVSNPNSPFAKKTKNINKIEDTSIQIKEEILEVSNDKDVPEITVLHPMFKKNLVSNPNSPFAKKTTFSIIHGMDDESILENVITNTIEKKKTFFGKR